MCQIPAGCHGDDSDGETGVLASRLSFSLGGGVLGSMPAVTEAVGLAEGAWMARELDPTPSATNSVTLGSMLISPCLSFFI